MIRRQIELRISVLLEFGLNSLNFMKLEGFDESLPEKGLEKDGTDARLTAAD